MANPQTRSRTLARLLVPLLGVALLVCLVRRAGAGTIIHNAKTIGWGMVFVLALAGFAHVIKTWAWRLTLAGESHKVPFFRTLGLRLASEAVGQFGVIGQVFGEGLRVSLLGSNIPVANGISSVTLDRGLFIASGALVTVAGLLAATVMASLSGRLKLYVWLFVIVLLGLLAVVATAFRNRWPLFSGTARAAGRVPWLRDWLKNKESIIESAEHQFLQFHRRSPAAFWTSLLLNVVTHLFFILEVYLILGFLGTHVSLVSALILESMTKLINVIGAVNPGNIGTYEGGNMAIVKLVGLTSTEGLILGLCRRFRAIFWAIIGGLCLVWLSKSNDRSSRPAEENKNMSLERNTYPGSESQSYTQTAIVLSNARGDDDPSQSVLAEVGALPLVLRAILSARKAGADHIIVAGNPLSAATIRARLLQTRRLPPSIEWVGLSEHDVSLSELLGRAGRSAKRVTLISGDRAFHPSLHRMIGGWAASGDALELTTAGNPIGMIALSQALALELASDPDSHVFSLEDLHNLIASRHAGVLNQSVPEDMWQQVASPEDRLSAERKLDHWLVKPTDGIFARFNRRVSIPISRQLIRFPITPNMVSLFTLLVSFLAGACFALGGYWNTLLGAILSVWASILDGSDGEVARLKLLASDFGAWLETICDYLYYLFIFAGMAIGLARSTGKTSFVAWGCALFVGAIITFIIAGLGRQQLSGDRPEQYLAVWQKKAESHLANPLIYVGRYTEFIVRRCFLPYALLGLALLNLTAVALYLSAIGANLAWMISLRSHLTFSSNRTAMPVSGAPAAKALST